VNGEKHDVPTGADPKGSVGNEEDEEKKKTQNKRGIIVNQGKGEQSKEHFSNAGNDLSD
jgi:hypothetical protein